MANIGLIKKSHLLDEFGLICSVTFNRVVDLRSSVPVPNVDLMSGTPGCW